MSWGSKHPLVLRYQQITPDELKGPKLSDAEHARSMADHAHFMSQSARLSRTSTRNPYLRDLLAARIKSLDARAAELEAIAEKAEKEAAQEAAQGGEK
ncbi:hypothetical protein [Xanthomonas arboricola]|uniref:hypothetical protein n=1 Tax=Xanthomonas arboricola TaxID=56448 RepID=UPI004040A240